MKLHKIQIDEDFDDDGLCSITFWFEDAPRYITLCRDELACPSSIYIEYTDQIYGFETRDIEYSFENGRLTLKLLVNSFRWNNSSDVGIYIPEAEIDSVTSIMEKIFDLN